MQAAPKAYADEAIAERVVNLIDWDVTIPTGAVRAKVENGFVTLMGEVTWDYQRQAAERGVPQLLGVRGLANQIVVKPQLQATDIKRRIEEALERQADLEADKISVIVDGGRVRLEGKVRAWF